MVKQKFHNVQEHDKASWKRQNYVQCQFQKDMACRGFVTLEFAQGIT